ncbi:MAG: dTMP kinase, partial [Thaumarchaeota archaeon]|nr:dTMP kinase [Nitrososphaerota archaeon]
FAADRMIHLKRVILPLLEKGFIVVSDRYLHSSLAYQSVTTGDQSWVEELNKYSRRPDVAILLDVDPAVGLERLKKRRKTRFERIEFLRQVREKYLEYVDRGELLRIDAGRDSEMVFSEIVKAVETALEKKKL